jgi:hypothetical protein
MYDRAHLWYFETLDGGYALLDENQKACEYGNEFTHSGVQHETRDEYHGKCGIDQGNGYIRPVVLICSKIANKIQSEQLLVVLQNSIAIH